MIWALLLLLVSACGLSAAEENDRRFTVDSWTVDEGLPQNSVLSIAQTAEGYLWLGTLNGLARFDGTRFRAFDENNTPSLQNSRIVKLLRDSADNLWVGTEAGGIYIVSAEGKFSTASLAGGKETAGGRLVSAAEDKSGAVWLYTEDGRLGRYHNGNMDVWSAGANLTTRTRALAAEAAGYLWVGTDAALTGLGPLPASGTTLTQAYSLEVNGRLDYLLTSRRGGFWNLANGKIQKMLAARVDRDFGPYPWPPSVAPTAACEDLQGNLVVGTYGDPGQGVFWFDAAGRAQHITNLSHQSVLSLHMDHEGSLWVGTDGGGLNRLRPQLFRVLETSLDSTVQSLVAAPERGLWIGYNGERIDYTDSQGTRQYPVRQGALRLAVRALLIDSNQSLWAGTFGAGLLRLREGQFFPDPDYIRVGNASVSSLFQDRQGRLWAGSQGGLVYHDKRFWRTLSVLDGLSGNSITAIGEDSHGNIWAGTDGHGLNRISGRTVTIFGRTNGLPSDNVSSLHIDKQDVIWVGTSAGLARFDGKRWTTFTSREGLPGNSMGYLFEDPAGWLWMGSRSGLMRAQKESLNGFADGKIEHVSVRAYGKADGLPTRECSQGSQPAACATLDGKLWFPTIKGVVSVNPADLVPNTNPPPVVIDSVLIDGESQATNFVRRLPIRTATLPAGKRTLAIHFASLNLSAPAEGRWRYRLENHEEAWSEGSGNIGQAHYTRLPKGNYTFRVQASNQDQVWNEAGASLAVTVLPPFWQTGWFLTTVAVLLLASIVGTVHYISTQKLQRQLASLRQKEMLEEERSRIARDLHDQLGANLTQVALLGEMAEADKELPAEVAAHARQICQTARETTTALDEIVWTVNPANDTLDGLINYICKYTEDYLAMAGLKYRIEIPPKLPSLGITPELRHNAFLAAKEAVNNVVKHSGADSAWLRLALEPGQFTLEIEDNGKGLQPEDYEKGRSGLRNMRKRMEDVGGRFEALPGKQHGTVVRLTAPIAIAADGASLARAELES